MFEGSEHSGGGCGVEMIYSSNPIIKSVMNCSAENKIKCKTKLCLSL